MTKAASKARGTVKSKSSEVLLSSRDVCKIIKQCRENGVLELNIEGLSLKLREESVKKPVPLPQPAPEPVELPKAAEADPELSGSPIEEEIAQMLVTDPYAYEELMLSDDAR
jgi:hypothetical protein